MELCQTLALRPALLWNQNKTHSAKENHWPVHAMKTDTKSLSKISSKSNPKQRQKDHTSQSSGTYPKNIKWINVCKPLKNILRPKSQEQKPHGHFNQHRKKHQIQLLLHDKNCQWTRQKGSIPHNYRGYISQTANIIPGGVQPQVLMPVDLEQDKDVHFCHYYSIHYWKIQQEQSGTRKK